MREDLPGDKVQVFTRDIPFDIPWFGACSFLFFGSIATSYFGFRLISGDGFAIALSLFAAFFVLGATYWSRYETARIEIGSGQLRYYVGFFNRHNSLPLSEIIAIDRIHRPDRTGSWIVHGETTSLSIPQGIGDTILWEIKRTIGPESNAADGAFFSGLPTQNRFLAAGLTVVATIIFPIGFFLIPSDKRAALVFAGSILLFVCVQQTVSSWNERILLKEGSITEFDWTGKPCLTVDTDKVVGLRDYLATLQGQPAEFNKLARLLDSSKPH